MVKIRWLYDFSSLHNGCINTIQYYISLPLACESVTGLPPCLYHRAPVCVLSEIGPPAFWLQQPQCPLHPDWGPGGKALWAWVPWDRMYELPSRLPGCTHTSTWDGTGGAREGCVCVCKMYHINYAHNFLVLLGSFIHVESPTLIDMVYLPNPSEIHKSLSPASDTHQLIAPWEIWQ